MRKFKINIYILLIFALFLNPIIIGGKAIFCYLFFYGTAFLYVLLHARTLFFCYLRKMEIKLFSPLVWIPMSLILSVAIPLYKGTNDYTYVNVVLGIFRKALIIVFLFLVTSKKYEKGQLVEAFMMYYTLASILYVIGTMIFTLVPQLKYLWQGVLRMNSSTLNLLTSYGYTNRFGWAGFAGFRNTIDCTLSLIFTLYLYSKHNKAFQLKVSQFVPMMFFCFIGNMFYGRSGIIASAICIVIGMLFYKIIKPKVILILSAAVVIGVILINVFRSRIPAIDEWYNWIRIPFQNLVTTGSFNNYSVNRLFKEMIFLPSSNTLLFGDGRYTDFATGRYYMNTDSGFMRQILFWGIIISSIMYLFCVHSLFLMKRDTVLKIMLLIMSVIFEIKGEVYYELMPLFLVIAFVDRRIITKKSYSC